jgi:hypothetical protein
MDTMDTIYRETSKLYNRITGPVWNKEDENQMIKMGYILDLFSSTRKIFIGNFRNEGIIKNIENYFEREFGWIRRRKLR